MSPRYTFAPVPPPGTLGPDDPGHACMAIDEDGRCYCDDPAVVHITRGEASHTHACAVHRHGPDVGLHWTHGGHS